MAANVTGRDGLPRFIWTYERPDPATYTLTLLRAIAERQRWRAQYQAAKDLLGAVDNRSATGTDPPDLGPAHSSASPDNPPHSGPQDDRSRESAANRAATATAALDVATEGPNLPDRGRPSTQPPQDVRRNEHQPRGNDHGRDD